MNEFRLKDRIGDKDFMIIILNNLPKEYDIILDELENCLNSITGEALIIEVIWEKLNLRYENLRRKMNQRKKKAFGVYSWQYKGRYHKSGKKYDHKPTDQKCPENRKENKNEKKRKKKMNIKRDVLAEIASTAARNATTLKTAMN